MNGKQHSHFAKQNVSLPHVKHVVATISVKTAQPDVKSGHRSARRLLTQIGRSVSPRSSKLKINGQERHVSPASRAGVTPNPVNGNGGFMHTAKKEISPRAFRPFGEYDNGELRAVKFRSDKAADHALVLIGKSPKLKKMPFLFANGLTFIIPQEAIDLLKGLNLRFSISRVLEMADLDPEERAEIRRTQCL